jgi:hypothetical protein
MFHWSEPRIANISAASGENSPRAAENFSKDAACSAVNR